MRRWNPSWSGYNGYMEVAPIPKFPPPTPLEHRYHVRYGDMEKTGTRYCVIDRHANIGDSEDGLHPKRVVFKSDFKSACIAEAQRLNGFEPVDGSEQTYGDQISGHRR